MVLSVHTLVDGFCGPQVTLENEQEMEDIRRTETSQVL